MLFNSLTFVVFYVVVTTLYWSMRGWNARKNLLVVASYIFYGAWNPPFAALLFTTTAMDFWLGRQIARAQDRHAKKRWLVASVCMNLSMLGFFKYGNFLLQNFQWLIARIGIIYQPPHLDILLPVGISFYTFHSLSYTLDIYRGVLRPTRSLRDFVLAVSFFPQLVAGPIVRAGDFLPQIEHPPRLKTNQFLWGLALMTLGLFEKIVLADTLLSGAADRVFSYGGPLIALDSWAGVLAFAGQIFCDFAGYSLTAIGAALTLGFHLKDNFRFPYAAIGFSDFWRRWHISLSTFLRDYLYIPLGGNQVGSFRMALNLVIVMFLGGLWHGAAWTFVVWGLLHGSYLVIERVIRIFFEQKPWTATLPIRLLAGFATYGAVCIAWVFFRAPDFSVASRMLTGMFGGHAHGDMILSGRELLQVGIVTVGLMSVHWAMREEAFETTVMRLPAWAVAAIWSFMACAIIFTQGSSNAFIYFQF
ncbi:MAG TPA: MBOAT family O-acyltransferase [Chthoniobacterales bacterium]|jgi:D-alanyl-lipoteichoic acid acyltransferase DltB (MBOAT superfamily)|nr:MBOAT family O-acyltransferase [Chthoniobacterales bacterium]